MAERFFCPGAATGARLVLEYDEARHLSRARRVGAGEVVEVFDGRGFATMAEVVSIGKDRVELQATGPPLPDRVVDVRVTLATAVPKGDRFDWLVEKATELGVDRLVPLNTERSVVDPRSAKLDRLRRAVVEASKQCGRSRLMEITGPTAWAEFLEAPGPALRLVAHPGGLGFADWPDPGAGGSAVLAVGPEGGFADAEVRAARGAGWVVAGLGPTLLRVETAGLVGCARLIALGERNPVSGTDSERERADR
jgi:16S rRNA (uracil1498-N3)-methyltransferase